jgi:hypothetical protein
MSKKIIIAKTIHEDYLKGVIINCPLLALYDEEGGLIEVSPIFPSGANKYQRGLINKIVKVINATLEMYDEEELKELVPNKKDKTPLPNFMKSEFPDDFQPV